MTRGLRGWSQCDLQTQCTHCALISENGCDGRYAWLPHPHVPNHYSDRGMVKTATGRNGDKLKRLQVQSKHVHLLSSTMDLFSELFTKFQLIQLCSFCSAVIS